MRLIRPSFEILTPIDRVSVLSLIEFSGRTCYKSEDRMTPDSGEKFCRMVVNRNHLSVIEHASCTVKFVIDRGVSHELVRHRLCSFSQESTRYCNYGKQNSVTFIIPPWVDLPEGEVLQGDETQCCSVSLLTASVEASPRGEWLRAIASAECTYLALLAAGWQPQQARSVLPSSLKTEIVVTANLREWRHIFDLRCDKAAHPQMQEVMQPLQRVFRTELPEIFGSC